VQLERQPYSRRRRNVVAPMDIGYASVSPRPYCVHSDYASETIPKDQLRSGACVRSTAHRAGRIRVGRQSAPHPRSNEDGAPPASVRSTAHRAAAHSGGTVISWDAQESPAAFDRRPRTTELRALGPRRMEDALKGLGRNPLFARNEERMRHNGERCRRNRRVRQERGNAARRQATAAAARPGTRGAR